MLGSWPFESGASGVEGPCDVPDSLTSGYALRAIQEFDGTPCHVAILGEIGSARPIGTAKAIEERLPSLEGSPLWAALYVYSMTARPEEKRRVLKPFLEHKDFWVQLQAAGPLIGLGVKEAIPVFLEALRQKDACLPYSGPCAPVPDYARRVLEEVTGKSHATADKWDHWWTRVGDELHWNPKKKKYRK